MKAHFLQCFARARFVSFLRRGERPPSCNSFDFVELLNIDAANVTKIEISPGTPTYRINQNSSVMFRRGHRPVELAKQRKTAPGPAPAKKTKKTRGK
jgi:hypothetical protein